MFVVAGWTLISAVSAELKKWPVLPVSAILMGNGVGGPVILARLKSGEVEFELFVASFILELLTSAGFPPYQGRTAGR